MVDDGWLVVNDGTLMMVKATSHQSQGLLPAVLITTNDYHVELQLVGLSEVLLCNLFPIVVHSFPYTWVADVRFFCK